MHRSFPVVYFFTSLVLSVLWVLLCVNYPLEIVWPQLHFLTIVVSSRTRILMFPHWKLVWDSTGSILLQWLLFFQLIVYPFPGISSSDLLEFAILPNMATDLVGILFVPSLFALSKLEFPFPSWSCSLLYSRLVLWMFYYCDFNYGLVSSIQTTDISFLLIR